jgi:lipopolysaccharide transport system permease protein
VKIKEHITVYSAQASNRSIRGHIKDILRDLPKAHELGLRLFKRNLKALYRQSLLGFAWAILPPLATAALWILLRGSNVVMIGDTGIAYPIFVLTGTILWQIFSEAISAPINQVNDNKTMLSKINIPREGLLLSGVYQLAFNSMIKILLLAIMYLFFRQAINLTSLVFAPLGIFVIGFAGFSIGLALTPLGMLYQDISRGLVVLLPFLMYLTPVVYPVPHEGVISVIMKLNPLATLIDQTRNWLTSQPVHNIALFWIFTLAFALLFMISLVIYRISMPMIIERLGS